MSLHTTPTSNENPAGETSLSIAAKLIVIICFFSSAAAVGFGITLKTGPFAIDLEAARCSEVIVSCPNRDTNACLKYDPASTCGHPFYVKGLFVSALFFIFIALVLLKFRRKGAQIYKTVYVTAGLLTGSFPAAIIWRPTSVLLSFFAALLTAVTALVASPFIIRRIVSRFRRQMRTEVRIPNADARLRDLEAGLHVAGFILGIGFIANVFSFSFCV